MLRHILTGLICLSSLSLQSAEPEAIEAFTEPWADIELAASEMGILARIDIEEGAQVQAGQIIAALDDSDLQASLRVAEKSREARGSLESALADLERHQTELTKLKALRSRQHASQREVDRTESDVRVARARLLSVQEELHLRQLECERIQAQLRRRQIRSTIDGIVTELTRDEGEFVSPSAPTVARVVQLNPLQIQFSVPVAYWGHLEQGQTVMIHVGAATEPVPASIAFLSPTAEASSGTFRVKVRLPNDTGQWHSGAPSRLVLEPMSDNRPQILARRNQPR